MLHTSGTFYLHTGDTLDFSTFTAGYKPHEQPQPIDAAQETLRPSELVEQLSGQSPLETPDPIVNAMFAFSKIRVSESIYETAGGPMHGPGDESFYAAIWANDQAEYINPYFPFIGYDEAVYQCTKYVRHTAFFVLNSSNSR